MLLKFYILSVENIIFLQVQRFEKKFCSAKNVKFEIASLLLIKIPFFIYFQLARDPTITVHCRGPL